MVLTKEQMCVKNKKYYQLHKERIKQKLNLKYKINRENFFNKIKQLIKLI